MVHGEYRLSGPTCLECRAIVLMGLIFSAWLSQIGLLAPYQNHDYFLVQSLSDSATSNAQSTTGKDKTINWNKIDLAVFYNVFISPDNITNGLRIVKEQLRARNQSPTLRNATLYYTQIGATNVSLPECHNCKEISKVQKGNESLTLQAMYEYCMINPTRGRVIYIHDKGSFTVNEKNERLRRALTKAVFSSECTNMHRANPNMEDHEDEEDFCDVCSATIAVYPYLSTPGNMFLAECNYVRKLIPPNQFEERMLRLMHKAWNSTWRELGFPREPPERMDWQMYRESWVGVGRYSMEHWIYR